MYGLGSSAGMGKPHPAIDYLKGHALEPPAVITQPLRALILEVTSRVGLGAEKASSEARVRGE